MTMMYYALLFLILAGCNVGLHIFKTPKPLYFSGSFHWKIFSVECRGNLQERLHRTFMTPKCSVVTPGTSIKMESSDKT